MHGTGKINLPLLRLLVIILVTSVAAYFRLYQISELPPGDGYDPAYYGVDALQILNGERPIFFPTNYGREALFSYLVAVCVLVCGPTALAVHLASAIVGILTVPATYLLAEELFAEEKAPFRILGSAIAALMMAVSYWHLNWSRYGVRAILVPLFAAWTITYLWRGMRRQSIRDFIACGIVLGLSLYTYPVARLLPILVVACFIFHYMQQRKFTHRDVLNFVLIVGTSLAVFAPLGVYCLEHPDLFFQRIQQALIINPSQSVANNLQAFAQQTLRALMIYGIQGDMEPYSTIPGRPALNVFFAGLFCVGFITCLLQYKKPRYKLILTWWFVMFVPATISTFAPSAKRAIGTLPAVAMLIAIGALSLWHITQRWVVRAPRYLGKIMQPIFTGLVISGFLYSAIVTYRDNFVIWPTNPNLFTHFEVGTSMIGEYITTLSPDERIYVSPDLPDHPGILFHSRLRENVYGYNGRVCLVLPEKTTTGTTYIIAPSKDKLGLTKLQAHYPQGEIVYDGPQHYGEPYFQAYHVAKQNTATITPSHSLLIGWDSNIQLLGYDANKHTLSPGDTLYLTLYYNLSVPIEQDYTAFVHLLGPDDPVSGNSLWAQNDSEPCYAGYPTSSWHVGEIIIDTIMLHVPHDTPPGSYTLATGFYDFWTMERLPVIRGDAQDNVADLGTIQVE